MSDRGEGGPPRLEDLLHADEAPMRRELLRQIADLELRINDFRQTNAMFEKLPPIEVTGPAVLSTPQLEHVRDELLAGLNELHDRVARRLVEEFPAEALPEVPDAPPAPGGPPSAAEGRSDGESPGRRGRRLVGRLRRRRPPRSA